MNAHHDTQSKAWKWSIVRVYLVPSFWSIAIPEDPCMVRISTYIYHKFDPNVGKYTIHGSSGHLIHMIGDAPSRWMFRLAIWTKRFFMSGPGDRPRLGTTRTTEINSLVFLRKLRENLSDFVEVGKICQIFLVSLEETWWPEGDFEDTLKIFAQGFWGNERISRGIIVENDRVLEGFILALWINTLGTTCTKEVKNMPPLLSNTKIYPIWVFLPKIGVLGTPKWMVYNGKPY